MPCRLPPLCKPDMHACTHWMMLDSKLAVRCRRKGKSEELGTKWWARGEFGSRCGCKLAPYLFLSPPDLHPWAPQVYYSSPSPCSTGAGATNQWHLLGPGTGIVPVGPKVSLYRWMLSPSCQHKEIPLLKIVEFNNLQKSPADDDNQMKRDDNQIFSQLQGARFLQIDPMFRAEDTRCSNFFITKICPNRDAGTSHPGYIDQTPIPCHPRSFAYNAACLLYCQHWNNWSLSFHSWCSWWPPLLLLSCAPSCLSALPSWSPWSLRCAASCATSCARCCRSRSTCALASSWGVSIVSEDHKLTAERVTHALASQQGSLHAHLSARQQQFRVQDQAVASTGIRSKDKLEAGQWRQMDARFAQGNTSYIRMASTVQQLAWPAIRAPPN